MGRKPFQEDMGRGRERWALDGRVLGTGAFVDRRLAAVTPPRGRPVARALGVTPMAILRGVARGETALRRHALEQQHPARKLPQKVA